MFYAIVSKISQRQILYDRASLMAQTVKNLPAMQETWVQSLAQEDPLVKELATHSSALAWRIPWTEKPGRLKFMGSKRARYDWVTNFHFSLSDVTYMWNPQNTKRKKKQLVDKTELQQTNRYRNRPVVTRGWGRCNIGVRKWEVQTVGCKISYKGVLCNTANTTDICNNCKWKLTSKNYIRDFLGCPVVKNLPCDIGDVGSIPGQGSQILYATGKLSRWATTTEARVPQLDSLCTVMKDPAWRNEIPCAATNTQSSQINKY